MEKRGKVVPRIRAANREELWSWFFTDARISRGEFSC